MAFPCALFFARRACLARRGPLGVPPPPVAWQDLDIPAPGSGFSPRGCRVPRPPQTTAPALRGTGCMTHFRSSLHPTWRYFLSKKDIRVEERPNLLTLDRG